MHRSERRGTRGFTLIELLVVIAIIGLLSSVVLASLNAARQKARVAAARQDILQIARAVEAARAASGLTYLLSITGSGYTWGGGSAGADTRFRTALTNISTRAQTFEGLNQITNDPWGQVYVLDENEGESSPTSCSRDSIRTQNGLVSYRFEYGSEYCKANPSGVPGFY